MKKLSVFLMAFLLIFSLTGCHSQELKEKEIEIKLKNAKIENIMKNDEEQMKVVDTFNSLLMEHLSEVEKNGWDFESADFSDIQAMIGYDREIKSTLEVIFEDLDKDSFYGIEYSIYPFFDDETGNIVDIFMAPNGKGGMVFLELEWKDNVVIRYDYH